MVRGASGPEALLSIADRLDITELRASAAYKAAGALARRNVLRTLLPRAFSRQRIDHIVGLGCSGRRSGRGLGRIADRGIRAAAAEAVDGTDVELAAKGAVWVGNWSGGSSRWLSWFVADCGIKAASLEAVGTVVKDALPRLAGIRSLRGGEGWLVGWLRVADCRVGAAAEETVGAVVEGTFTRAAGAGDDRRGH